MSLARFTPSREAAKAFVSPAPRMTARACPPLAFEHCCIFPSNARRWSMTKASQSTSESGDELAKNFLRYQVRNLITKTERQSTTGPKDDPEHAMYVIRPSPGKDLGVFASNTIHSGTTILREYPLMTIMKDSLALEAKDVLAEFNKLKSSSQKDFLELQESYQQCESKLLSIWKANSFALKDNRGTAVWLDISRINHSCRPNTRFEIGSEGETTKIVATKTIAQGEEIFISYNDDVYGLPQDQRRYVLEWGWGFKCSCSACSLSGEERKVSDSRRFHIGNLSAALEGLEPVDWNEWKARLDACQNQTQRLRAVRLDQRPLSKPLHPGEVFMHNIALAQLLEAEGLLSIRVVFAYAAALNWTTQELRKSPDVIPIAYLESAKLCMNKILTISTTLGASEEEIKSFEKSFSALKSWEAMQVGMRFLHTAPNDDTNWTAIRLHRLKIDGKRATMAFGVSDKDYWAAIENGITPGPSYEEASRQMSEKTVKDRLAASMRGRAK